MATALMQRAGNPTTFHLFCPKFTFCYRHVDTVIVALSRPQRGALWLREIERLAQSLCRDVDVRRAVEAAHAPHRFARVVAEVPYVVP